MNYGNWKMPIRLKKDFSESSLQKTDDKERVKTPAERRESFVDELERSGLSGTKFAQLAGFKYHTFAVREARRNKERAKDSAPMDPKAPAQRLDAVFSSKSRVRDFAPQTPIPPEIGRAKSSVYQQSFVH